MRAHEFINESNGIGAPLKYRSNSDWEYDQARQSKADAETPTATKYYVYDGVLKKAVSPDFDTADDAKVARARIDLNPQHLSIQTRKMSVKEDTDAEFDEAKASPKICRSTKKLGSSMQSSCVSQGLRAHQSKGKGHTDGHGNYIKGKKAKSEIYGGSVKDYSGK